MSSEQPEPEGARGRLIAHARDRRFSLRELSRMVERNPSYLHQFVYKGSPRDLPEKERLKLASILGVHEGELRNEDPGIPRPLPQPPGIEFRNQTGRRLPVLSTRGEGGKMLKIPLERAAEFTDFLPGEGDGAYVIRITDPSLSPRFDLGDLALVDPEALAGPGDHVALVLRDATIEIGRLVERSGDLLELRRPGAPELARFPSASIASIGKIVAVAFR